MGAFLRKYGVGTGADVYVPMIKRAVVDYAVGADWSPAAGDVKVSKDGGAAANIGTLPVAVAMGNTAMWRFVFSDAELQCKTLSVTVADSATKAVEDQMFDVETYGHASALHPFDLGTALGTIQLTESYNADGAAPTLEQALFVIMQRLTEFSMAGSTITVKKLDGSTTAYELTTNSPTSPTSSTRSS